MRGRSDSRQTEGRTDSDHSKSGGGDNLRLHIPKNGNGMFSATRFVGMIESTGLLQLLVLACFATTLRSFKIHRFVCRPIIFVWWIRVDYGD